MYLFHVAYLALVLDTGLRNYSHHKDVRAKDRHCESCDWGSKYADSAPVQSLQNTTTLNVCWFRYLKVIRDISMPALIRSHIDSHLLRYYPNSSLQQSLLI